MMLSFILEGLGTSELMLILVIALIVFGPRKLPQLSRTIGKSIADFKRTSEDFKRTWEREVELESAQQSANVSHTIAAAPEPSILDTTVVRAPHADAATEQQEATTMEAEPDASAPSVREVDPADFPSAPSPPPSATAATTTTAPARKRDWL